MCYVKINELKKKAKRPFRDTSGVSRAYFLKKSLKFSMLEVLGVENDVVTVLWWHVSWCCLYEHCMRERFYDTLLFRVMISIRQRRGRPGGGM